MTEINNFAAGYSPYGSPDDGRASQLDRVLQEIGNNVQHFANNVTTIERKMRLLNTAQDSPGLREEIVQLVHDTTQLARYADSSIKKLRSQSRALPPGEKFQLDRLVNTFSSSGQKFQTLQQTAAELEQELLTTARSPRKYSESSYGDPEWMGEKAPLAQHDAAEFAAQAQRFSQMEDEAVIVEQREREMRALETDILDINDIFRDMGTMVNEQGEMIDHIEANVEVAGTRVEQGNKQLEKAVSYKRCSRKLTLCICCIVTTVLIIIIIALLVLLRIFVPEVYKSK